VIGGYPASMPLRPRELAATIYEALEIGPEIAAIPRNAANSSQ